MKADVDLTPGFAGWAAGGGRQTDAGSGQRALRIFMRAS
jgi:hypothetical protein